MRKIIFFAAMLFAVSVSAQVNIANGLLAYYPYNGNANDESGNAYNGTVNGATLTTDRFGNISKAYQFNGTKITSQVPYNFDNDYSFNLWFKISNVTMVSNIFRWGSRFSNDYSYAIFGTANPNIYSTLTESNTSVPCIFYCESTSNGSPYYNSTWHMASSVKFGNNISLFIDTVLVSSAAINDSCNQNLDIFELIIGYDLAGQQFSGNIDDVMIHNRPLNTAEISYLYALNSSWSSTTSTEIFSSNDIDIFPNPVENSINIQFYESAAYFIEVTDLNGKRIFSGNFSGQNFELNSAEWNNGVYLCKARHENGSSYLKKIIKY